MILIAIVLPEAVADCFFQMVSRADLTMCVTGMRSMAFMSRCRMKDSSQLWVQSLVEPQNPSGFPAFTLRNAGTRLYLQHGTAASSQVTCGAMGRRGAVVNSSLWTIAPVESGYLSVKSYQNSNLDLDIEHGDWNHGGVKEGNFLIVHPYNRGENEEWVFPNLMC